VVIVGDLKIQLLELGHPVPILRSVSLRL
jgi:hypothetical protein